MKKLALSAIIIAISGAAWAAHGYGHLWVKTSTSYGTDPYGNRVMICNWKCNADIMRPHYATTEGIGFCPRPM